jgi:hypothetical protein
MEETTIVGRLPEHKVSVNLPGSGQKKIKALEFIVYLFILLFIYAGVRKLVDLKMFVKEVWGFSLFGTKAAVKWEFIILSVVELLIALLLAIPRTRQIGLYATFFIMVVINACFFYMLEFAKIIPMFYGGILPAASFDFTLYFNVLMLFLSLAALLIFRK